MLHTVTTGLAFAEGPVPLPDGSVLVVEVLGGRLTRVAADGSKSVVAYVGGGPNGAALGPDGRVYICNNGGFAASASDVVLLPQEAPFDQPPGSIQTVDLATGAVTTLYAHSSETPFWGPNDLVFDKHGGFWFTDHGRNRGRIRQIGAVWYARADGSGCREVISHIDHANGIGLSADGGTLFVADTMTAHLLSFRISGPGEIDPAGGPFFGGATIIGRAGPGQFLDSLAVDSNGAVCVASPGGSCVLVFDPNGGGLLRSVPTPDFLTTNIAFGGADLRTAFITLGSSGTLVKMDWPVPGLALT